MCCWCDSSHSRSVPAGGDPGAAPGQHRTGQHAPGWKMACGYRAARGFGALPDRRCAATAPELRLRGRLRRLAGPASARQAHLRSSSVPSNGTVALSAEARAPTRRAGTRVRRTALPAPSRACAPRWRRISTRCARNFSRSWQQLGRAAATAATRRGAGRCRRCCRAAVLKIHEDRAYPGAVVASLSVPWGNSTDSLGGYHLVWPRDATLTAFALLAAHQMQRVRDISWRT